MRFPCATRLNHLFFYLRCAQRAAVRNRQTSTPACLIKRLIKVGARVAYHARRWYAHVASAFPLAHHYRSVLAWGPSASQPVSIWSPRDWYARNLGKIDFPPKLCYFTLRKKKWLL